MDEYDQQIEELTVNPQHISTHWKGSKGLFKTVGNTLFQSAFVDEVKVIPGCLTQIRFHDIAGHRGAFIGGKLDIALTNEIVKDERIPKDETQITVADLPVFAEWQRRLDAIRASK